MLKCKNVQKLVGMLRVFVSGFGRTTCWTEARVGCTWIITLKYRLKD